MTLALGSEDIVEGGSSENPTWHMELKHLELVIQELAQAGHLSKLIGFQRNSK